MTKNTLRIISKAMQEMKLSYAFMEWTSEPVDLYFVGEYQEIEPMYENGLQESTFLLTGFSRDSWLSLLNATEKIADYFNKVSGKTVMAEDGSAVAIFYAYSLIVPTGDAELKRVQINLDVKEWSVK